MERVSLGLLLAAIAAFLLFGRCTGPVYERPLPGQDGQQ